MSLSDYLETVSKRRWQYGSLDCCTFMADWLMQNGYADPMADRRGTYANKAEYRRMIKSEGGLVASCIKRFAAIGLRETKIPICGAVMIVLAPFAYRNGRILTQPTGAIYHSERLRSIVCKYGLIGAPLPMVKAWNI